MRIKKITETAIHFNNGSILYYDHYPDCCEVNYADFKQIEDEAYDFDFPEDLDFDIVEGLGFRFGKKGVRMFYIPCYSEQNGYYSDEVDIYYQKPNRVERSTFTLHCEQNSI